MDKSFIGYAVCDPRRGIESMFVWTIRGTEAAAIAAYNEVYNEHGGSFEQAKTERGYLVRKVEIRFVG